MRFSRTFFAAVCFVAGFWAHCLAQVPDEGAVVGELHVERTGAPSRRIEVTLESRGAMIGMIYADDEGKFGFYNLKGNEYHIVIDDPAYQPVDVAVAVNPEINRENMVPIFLVPKRDSVGEQPSRPGAHVASASSIATQDARAVGSNPYLSNPAEYNKNFSKAAIKEFEKGGESLNRHKIDDAIKHYSKALEIAPDYYPARNDLGSAYVQKGDFAAAEKEFGKAMAENPSDASAYFNSANVELLTKNYAEGERFVDAGLSKQPNSATGLLIRGSIDRHIGKLPQAERSLRDALQADPTLANAHLELANLYRQEEKRPEMISELQAFLKIFPAHPLAPQVKEALKKLNAPVGN